MGAWQRCNHNILTIEQLQATKMHIRLSSDEVHRLFLRVISTANSEAKAHIFQVIVVPSRESWVNNNSLAIVNRDINVLKGTTKNALFPR